jgi:hypothetical protein
VTSCQLEYGTASSYGRTVPCTPTATIGTLRRGARDRAIAGPDTAAVADAFGERSEAARELADAVRIDSPIAAT